MRPLRILSNKQVSTHDPHLPQISVQCQIYDFQALDKASLNDVYKLAIFNDQSFNTQAVETEVREQGYVFFEANLVNSESRAVI